MGAQTTGEPGAIDERVSALRERPYQTSAGSDLDQSSPPFLDFGRGGG
jgi:hypothetical protein